MSLKLITKPKILDLYRGINEFGKVYQPRINIINDENGNLLADPHSGLKRWEDFFNHVPIEHRIHNVRQMNICMAEPLVPESSLVKVEITIGKLKSYKSLGSDQIPAELIKAGGEKLCSMWNKEELPWQRKKSLIVPIYKKGDKTDWNNY
jgi:hypothetical protein